MILASRLESTLVFHKYVDQYFLEQIWSGGEQEGTQVPQSRSERTIRQQLSQTHRSNMSGQATIVTINTVASLF